ncbi:testis-expressed protein 13B [Suricata suricatta]|uniref:RanBP2-type domain-containing protein n=1 Tax=Suricata suricatta TaxID=37032 RepID=A0A673UU81_SURSU|nr:testis-expressed protein 13B [Suricata suricatta]
MALNPDDPNSGFQHGKVVTFINEKIAGHMKGPEFYLENTSLPWEEVEDKLRAILEDSTVSSEAKEACAWSSLALGVRFACRQGQLHRHRVHWLHDFAKLHKSTAQTLASDLKKFTTHQEMERKEAAFRLRLAQANLAEVQRERDFLKWKLLQLQSPQKHVQVSEQAGLATRTEVAGEVQEVGAAGISTTSAGTTGRERRRQKNAEGTEAAKELVGGLMHLLGAVEQKNYTTSGQKEGDLKSVDTAMFYFSGTIKPRATVTPSHLPVQLPASFTYSYACPFSPFPPAPTPIPPATPFTVGAPVQTSPHWRPSEVSVRSNVESQGKDPQEHQRDRRDSDPYQHRRPPILRRPGDWDCPWCKAVNFSRREICFRCGRGIWLQSPQ